MGMMNSSLGSTGAQYLGQESRRQVHPNHSATVFNHAMNQTAHVGQIGLQQEQSRAEDYMSTFGRQYKEMQAIPSHG